MLHELQRSRRDPLGSRSIHVNRLPGRYPITLRAETKEEGRINHHHHHHRPLSLLWNSLSWYFIRSIPITMTSNNAPLFTTSKDLSASTQAAIAQRGTPATLNLDDIFGDVVFTPDGDTVFRSETEGLLPSGEGGSVSATASRPTAPGSTHFAPVPQGGGLYTTALAEAGKMALAMGKATDAPQTTAPVPFTQTPQQQHHLQYAAAVMAPTTTAAAGGAAGNTKKRKSMGETSSSRSGDRKMSEQQKVERRYVWDSFFPFCRVAIFFCDFVFSLMFLDL